MEYTAYDVESYAQFLVNAANACPRTEYYWVQGVEMVHVKGDCPEKHLVEGWFLTFCEVLAASPYYVVPRNVHEACVTLSLFSCPSQVIWDRLQAVLHLH
jgi:hypothetical protein